MNRTLIFGIATFFALVGIALLGGENKAVAGHGCHGCDGGGCDGGGCHGGGLFDHGCHGCHGGLLSGLFDHGCHGGCHGGGLLSGLFGCHGDYGCHGGCHGDDYGCHGGHDAGAPVEGDVGAPPAEDVPPAPDAPVAPEASRRAPFGFRQVSFAR